MNPTPTQPQEPLPATYRLAEKIFAKIVHWRNEGVSFHPTDIYQIIENDNPAPVAPESARLTEACVDFRDCVLNQRHELEAPCLDNGQTNAVLGLFDDIVGPLLSKTKGGDDKCDSKPTAPADMATAVSPAPSTADLSASNADPESNPPESANLCPAPEPSPERQTETPITRAHVAAMVAAGHGAVCDPAFTSALEREMIVTVGVVADSATRIGELTVALTAALANTAAAEKDAEEDRYEAIDSRMSFAKLLGIKECFTPDIEDAIRSLRSEVDRLTKELARAAEIGGLVDKEAQETEDTLRARVAELEKERDDALAQAKQARVSRHAQEELAKNGFAKWKQDEVDLLAKLATVRGQLGERTAELDSLTGAQERCEKLVTTWSEKAKTYNQQGRATQNAYDIGRGDANHECSRDLRDALAAARGAKEAE